MLTFSEHLRQAEEQARIDYMSEIHTKICNLFKCHSNELEIKHINDYEVVFKINNHQAKLRMLSILSDVKKWNSINQCLAYNQPNFTARPEWDDHYTIGFGFKDPDVAFGLIRIILDS